jgi:hypothetical protein
VESEGTADEAVLNTAHRNKIQTNPPVRVSTEQKNLDEKD